MLLGLIFPQQPPAKPPPSLLSPLIHQLNMSIPVEFQLPEDIRTFFKDGASFFYHTILHLAEPDLLLQSVKGQKATILIQCSTNCLAKGNQDSV